MAPPDARNGARSPNGRDRASGDAAYRAVEVLVAATALAALALPFGVIAAAVWAHDRGPVFHRGRRVGQHGVPFGQYKFRTMVPNAAAAGPGVTRNGDPRITPVGRWLRRTKLDELPQLFNVLCGDMSFVGPRPEDPRFVALYSEDQRKILAFRPGITSPASVEFRDEEDGLVGDDWERAYVQITMPRKLAIDMAYFARRTVWSDLGVVVRTLSAVLRIGEQARREGRPA